MPVAPVIVARRSRHIVTSSLATWFILIGGVLFGVSALRPWAAGGGVLLKLGLVSFSAVLVVGIVTVAVGLTLLVRGISIGRIVLLWILSTTEILALILLQISSSRGANDFSYFGVFLAPSSGFYIALAGTVVVTVGSLLAQVAMIKSK